MAGAVPVISSRPSNNNGKIVAENPDLLKLLRDNTMEQQELRRVYVQSPEIGADDDSYRYVSTDAFDDDRDHAMYAVDTSRINEHQSEPSSHGPTGSYNSTRLKNNPVSNIPKYNKPPRYQPQYSDGRQSHSPETQYVMRSRGGSIGSEASKRTTGSHVPSVVYPIVSPLRGMSRDDEEDQRTLEEESAYQHALRSRIDEQGDSDGKKDIPKLSLDFMNDEPERGPADSLELTQFVPDDYYEDQGSQVSSNKTWQKQSDQQKRELDDLKAQKDLQQQQQHLIQQQQQQLQNVLTQQQQQSQMMMMLMMQQQQKTTPQQVNPLVVGGQPLALDNQQPLVYPVAQSPPLNINQQSGFQQVNQENYKAVPTMNTVSNHQGDFRTADIIHSEPYQVNESDISSIDGTLEADTASSPVQSPRHINYVAHNKQVLKTGAPKKTYSKIANKKKDFEVMVPKQALTKTGKIAPPLPDKGVPHSMPASASTQPPQGQVKPNSAEHVWQMRSKSLADQKNGKNNGVNKTHKPGALRKYPSESKVGQGTQNTAARPHRVVPLSQGSRTVAEPVTSHLMDGSSSPLRHTVVTDDGQRVNVDIDLKMNSPMMPEQRMSPTGSHTTQPIMQPAPQPLMQPVMQPVAQPIMQPVMMQPMTQSVMQPPMQPLAQPMVQPMMQPVMQYVQQGQQQPVYAMEQPSQPQHVTYSPQYQPQMSQQQYQQAPQMQSAQMPVGYTEPKVTDPVQGRTAPSPSTSPYKVLPPIETADTDKTEKSDGKSHAGYMDQYKKQQNRKIDYKVYTLKDYKTLKQEVRLGGLGPDIDTPTHKERKEKMQRQQEYAREVAEINRQQIRTQPITAQQPEERPSSDLMERRKLALEYSKSVPKPRVMRPVYEPPPGPGSPHSHRASERTTTTQGLAVTQGGEVDDLHRLQQRHEEERRKVAQFRANLDQYVS